VVDIVVVFNGGPIGFHLLCFGEESVLGLGFLYDLFLGLFIVEFINSAACFELSIKLIGQTLAFTLCQVLFSLIIFI